MLHPELDEIHQYEGAIAIALAALSYSIHVGSNHSFMTVEGMTEKYCGGTSSVSHTPLSEQ